MKKLVSIIITTYKRSDLLPRAICSALSQTYNNIEVIVVDDNDPDSDYRYTTENLIQTLYSGNNKLKYIKMSSNSGSCAARNYGVSVCKGEYINFLDDDDEFLPNKIEKQMKIYEADTERKLAVVGCYAEIFDKDNNIKGYEKVDIRGDVFYYQMSHNVSTTSLSLIRKDVYLESGGFEKMHSSQEHWMHIKLFSVRPYFDYVPEVLVRIFHHGGERISTNLNKPLGAVELYEKSKIFYNRFSPKQVENIKKNLNELIISSYNKVGDKKQVRYYIKERIKISHSFTVNDFIIYSKFVFGEKAFNKFWNMVLSIKHLGKHE